MDAEKKLALLEDMMEVDEGVLKPETELGDIDEWDSMAKLSLVVLMEDDFGKKISGEQIRGLITVQDILDMMG